MVDRQGSQIFHRNKCIQLDTDRAYNQIGIQGNTSTAFFLIQFDLQFFVSVALPCLQTIFEYSPNEKHQNSLRNSKSKIHKFFKSWKMSSIQVFEMLGHVKQVKICDKELRRFCKLIDADTPKISACILKFVSNKRFI